MNKGIVRDLPCPIPLLPEREQPLNCRVRQDGGQDDDATLAAISSGTRPVVETYENDEDHSKADQCSA
jgi:hypothetical protein